MRSFVRSAGFQIARESKLDCNAAFPIDISMSDATLSSHYGTLPDGRAVRSYTLTNARGIRVNLLDYGATVASISIPDRDGRVTDVTCWLHDLAGWLGNTSYFGANVGRYANRIAHGKFTLDGKFTRWPRIMRPGVSRVRSARRQGRL